MTVYYINKSYLFVRSFYSRITFLHSGESESINTE